VIGTTQTEHHTSGTAAISSLFDSIYLYCGRRVFSVAGVYTAMIDALSQYLGAHERVAVAVCLRECADRIAGNDARSIN
jgi:hypothetical protein